MQHPIIDLIIRIKNGYLAKKEIVESPHSLFREEILKKLVKLGFIKNYSISGEKIKIITVELLYKQGTPAISGINIISKPGRRWYVSVKDIKPVLNSFGYAILSTSKGILTNVEAKKAKVGGDLLFEIW